MYRHHKLITIISNDKLIEHLIPDMYRFCFCELYYNYIYFIFIINPTFSIVCLSGSQGRLALIIANCVTHLK